MKIDVIKTGFEMFDTLHAFGLAIFVATANSSKVFLQDDGPAYSIELDKCPDTTWIDTLRTILALPSIDELVLLDRKKPSMPVKTFDGLLAALFTTPGPRIVSVNDLLDKKKLSSDTSESVMDSGILKVAKAVQRWESFAEKHVKQLDVKEFWDNLFNEYAQETHVSPIPCNSIKGSISLLMTLDPGLSYSSRRFLSDGLISNQVNISISKPKFAPLFAFVGASRFLRAQRINHKSVNFYVPVPKHMAIDSTTSLEMLFTSSLTPDEALVMNAMRFASVAASQDWSGIAYQTMQIQGAKQSISVRKGHFDLEPFFSLKVKVSILKMWQSILSNRGNRVVETDDLIDFLLSRRPSCLFDHLLGWARRVIYSDLANWPRQYKLTEVKEMICMIDSPTPHSIASILLNEKGAIRFGHALRQLKGAQNHAFQDAMDELETVKDQEKLLLILSRAVEACAIQESRNPFMVIPDDKDLYFLLEEVRQFGIRQVASMLVILATLRYSKRDATGVEGLNAKAIDAHRDNRNG